MDLSRARGRIPAGSIRWAAAVAALTLNLACAGMAQTHGCAPGQSLSGGECLPTPALVFTRCVEAFRKTADEHEVGRETKLAVRAEPYGDAEVARGKQERDRAEYSGISDSMLSDAIVECRRQEEQERAHQIERAWAEAEAERTRARAAERAAHEATAAHASADARAERLADDLATSRDTVETLQRSLAEAEATHQQQQRRVGERYPCMAEDWVRCGEQALASMRAGDHRRAHELFEQACSGGDAKSCANWGMMFERGFGVAASATEAYARYEEACELGSAEACASQGILVMQGRGTQPDEREAARLLRGACKAEVPRACARLARMIETGAVASRESERGVAQLYAYACEADDARACLWLGDLAARSTDSRPPDPTAAALAYELACDGELPQACLRLAELYEVGRGVPQDHTRARALSQRACHDGLSSACASSDRLSHLADPAGVELR